MARGITLRRRNRTLILAALAAALLGTRLARGQDARALQAADPTPNAIWLDSLDLGAMSQDWKRPRAGRSVDNHPLTLGGEVYRHGVGTHARSELVVDLKQAALRFVVMAGVDDEKKGQGSVNFQVWVDGKKRAESGVLRGGDAPKILSVDLTGARRMILIVEDAGDGI